MQHKILNRNEISVFLIKLSSRTNKGKTIECINELKKLYPYDVNINNIILLKNNLKENYICIIHKDRISKEGLASTILYTKNHFKNYSGKVYFDLKNFKEVIKLDKGEILSSDIYKDDVEINKQTDKVITEDIFFKTYNDKDLIKIISSKDKMKRKLTFTAIVLILISILSICFHSRIDTLRLQNEEQKQLEISKANKDKIQKENENKLAELKLEYLKLCNQQFENVYNYIGAIYSCIGEKSIIENLSIEHNNFSVDVSTKDAIKILENFENKNQLLNEIKMNRTVIEGDTEYVTYSGTFNRNIQKPSNSSNLLEEIFFYQNEINKINNKLLKMNQVSISEYTKTIREKLHSCYCQEQYIQFRSDNGIAILECFIQSKSNNMLKFLNSIQPSNDVDVSSIQIRNSFDSNNIQTTIQFWTGIETKSISQDGIFNLENRKISPEEINTVFKKKESKVNTIKKRNTKPSVNSLNQKPIKNNSIKYIGKTKKQNETIIIFKNEEMNIIYKLPLLDSLQSYNCCINEESGKYILQINNKTYEVNE